MAKKKAVPAEDQSKIIQIKTFKKTKVAVKKVVKKVVKKAAKKAAKKSVPNIKIDTNAVFQFKITLVQSRPPIWRRIQVDDCMLDRLHEHIQTAMGWTNSHLHQFEIGGKQYADPMLMEEGMKEFGVLDSTRANISKFVPKTGKQFQFKYEYDFGDGWEHEILLEGIFPKEPGRNYPLCLEGERACPPEDVGGIHGFHNFLAAHANPKHENHIDMVRWLAKFDPDKFNAKSATAAMKKGFSDWR